MGFSGFISTDAFQDRTPNRQCWLLFRAGSRSRLEQFQKGKMYMNSVEFFSGMKDEKATALRKDELEKNYLKFHSRQDGDRISELFIEVNEEQFSLGPNAVMHVNLPNPSNIFIFCMAALAEGMDGTIQGEEHGAVTLSSRFVEFGDSVLVVKSNVEFSRRLNAAIASNSHLFSSPFFEGGFGQVDYVDMKARNGIVGLFRKDLEYQWQREYRFCIGADSEILNSDGALELDLGDLSDITSIVPVEQFASQAITLKRGLIEIKNGVPRHRYLD
ncbi:hypothetical protein [Pseudomonas lundensis]|uniref:hypothetical protein n=1 Tax=Pseudomonas lundensis TaxID=86185 RepID=UPI000BA1DDB7|nr:hypothetical protein [Pseudomonas lundensis]OZY45834.1 hypothetical protein CJF41_12890 [Pseudomonas lundensis]